MEASEEKATGPRWDLVFVGVALIAAVAYVVFVSAPKSSTRDRRSQAEQARVQMQMIADAIDLYQLTTRRVPDSLDDLTVEDDNGEAYLTDVPTDPWGLEFDYRPQGRRGYRLVSGGPDGVLDTDDDIVHEQR